MDATWVDAMTSAFASSPYLGFIVTAILIVIAFIMQGKRYNEEKQTAAKKITDAASENAKKAEDTTADADAWLNKKE